MAKFNDNNFDDSKLKRGSILYSSKISPVVEGEYALFNAYNMSWEGYKFKDNNEITYTGQVIAEINKKASTVSLDELRGTVDSLQSRSADYYVVRYAKIAKGTYPKGLSSSDDGNDISKVDDDSITYNGEIWTLLPDYSSETSTWMTSRKVIYALSGSTYVKQYSGIWSTPMKMTGDDAVSHPVHQVLLYKWHDSRTAPAVDIDSSTKPSGWQESPGNGTSNTYLWMIQGQRQDDNYIKWDTDGDINTAVSYWSSPVCLSGPDGQPGKDGTDIEFIYKRFTSEQTKFNENDNPVNWNNTAGIDFQKNDYLGPSGHEWNDNPSGVSSSYPYEYCSIRYKTNNVWGAFISPFLWSKFGENGLDGDGIEYIYCACNYNNIDDLNTHCPVPVFNLNTSDTSEIKAFQKSEVYDGTIWHDDPQQVNNTNQKYQWVSIRKFKKITDTNKTEISSSFTGDSYTINDITVHVGDKIWFPYSRPELWNWYVNDGTDASRIVMVYQRNNSGTVAPILPTKDDNNKTIITNILNGSQNGWCESPGNASNDHEYLWMTSAHYTNKESSQGSENSIIYTIEDSWQTAVCLTGEPGREGEDGSDVEFIYYRTANDNITFNDDWNNFGGDSSENGWPFDVSTGNANEIDGIKYYDPNGVFDEALSSDELHDVWTDNPLGVTST